MLTARRTVAGRAGLGWLVVLLAVVVVTAGCGQAAETGPEAAGAGAAPGDAAPAGGATAVEGGPDGEDAAGAEADAAVPEADVVWQVVAREFAFETDPEPLVATKGQVVRVVFDNRGQVEHDFVVLGLEAAVLDEGNMAADASAGGGGAGHAHGEQAAGHHHDHGDHMAGAEAPPVHAYAPGGGQDRLVFVAESAGTFRAVCTIPGHEQLGMVLEVTIND